MYLECHNKIKYSKRCDWNTFNIKIFTLTGFINRIFKDILNIATFCKYIYIKYLYKQDIQTR